jgi:hypothetical protein
MLRTSGFSLYQKHPLSNNFGGILDFRTLSDYSKNRLETEEGNGRHRTTSRAVRPMPDRNTTP